MYPFGCMFCGIFTARLLRLTPGSKIGLKTTVDEEPIPKLKTLSVVSNWRALKGAVEPRTPKPIPKINKPKRGVRYVFEGALEP